MLLTLLRQEPMYGYQILTALKDRDNGEFQFKHGTICPVLYRMERERWIEATWEDPPEGKRRKVCRVTPDGFREHGQRAAEWIRFNDAVRAELRADLETQVRDATAAGLERERAWRQALAAWALSILLPLRSWDYGVVLLVALEIWARATTRVHGAGTDVELAAGTGVGSRARRRQRPRGRWRTPSWALQWSRATQQTSGLGHHSNGRIRGNDGAERSAARRGRRGDGCPEHAACRSGAAHGLAGSAGMP